MFTNKKVVVSASLKFNEEVEKVVKKLKLNKNEVLEYVRCDERKYSDVLYDFYTAIDNTDILLVINKEKNGIKGYIGNSVFSEINYAVLKKIINGKNVEIYLSEEVDSSNTCYDEIKYFIENNMIKILNESDKEILGI